MFSHMPIPHLGASNYVESNHTPSSPYHSRIPEPVPRTVNHGRLVIDETSFPMAPNAPYNPVHPSYQERYSMRTFVPCGVSRGPSRNDEIQVIAARMHSLQEIEAELAKDHGVETADFTGAEKAEKELKSICRIKISIPKFDSAELLERVRARARLHSDPKSKQALDTLHELHHLRPKFWSLPQIPHFDAIKPKWMPGQPYCHPDTSRFWAVLIGIDDYESSPLRGAVSDALLMKDYLQKDLRMPETHIECLLSSGIQNAILPSRKNIIRKLLNLATDTQIQYGDNIIVFFSGHGTSYSCSKGDGYDIHMIPNAEGWRHLSFPIEALCPADRGESDGRRTPIPDISDREMNGILHHIARTKGHKITVILDCCHSGSGTRDIQDQAGVRSVAPLGSPEAMLDAANETLSGCPDYHSVVSEDWWPDKSSHVTLAACTEYQFAKETQERGAYNGVFTRSLVRALRSGHCKKETTYVDLIRALPWSPLQNPVVTGDHKRALLWHRV
ncbi:caspase domain-containing protein [Armillaria mellea]|nr:caspase domain-containing protein [Armillaria mellea]